jgi:hypothetical protein
MKSRSATLVAVFWIALCTTPMLSAQGSALTRDDRELFKWFDGLGYTPDLADKTLVAIETGFFTLGDGTQRVPQRLLGFLLSDSAEAFVVHLTTATDARYVRTGPTSTTGAVDFTRLNLRATADVMARWAREPGSTVLPANIPRYWRTQLTLFMLARACAAAGFDDLAHELVAASQVAERTEGSPYTLKQELSGTIANQRVALAFADFERGGTRVAFREEVKRLVLNFPQADFAKTESSAGREMLRELDRMIGEDSARTKRQAPATLQGRARIAELIFLLRDQHAPQRTMPGYPDFVCGWALSDDARRSCEDQDSPVRQLINAGPAAVPQLIEALDDTRLTRAVHYYRPGLPTQVLRVGDCALQILESISGLRFTSVAAPLHALTKNERKTLKDNVNKWWESVRGKTSDLPGQDPPTAQPAPLPSPPIPLPAPPRPSTRTNPGSETAPRDRSCAPDRR